MAEHAPTPPEPRKAHSDLRRHLDVITTIALGVMAVVVLYRNLGTSPKTESASAPRITVPSEPVDLGPDRMGHLSSPVGIVVFSDFECTYCADFANTKLPLILRSYVDTGKVIVGFRHFPNESSHRSALGAARASACASEQGRFWPFHDRLFANSTELDSNSLRKVARDVGVGEDAFNRCLSGSGGERVDKDLRAALALGLGGTPAAIIGLMKNDWVLPTAVIMGNRPLSEFDAAISAAMESRHLGGQ